VAFANTGDPSTPAMTWPAWSAASEQYVDFGDSIVLQMVSRARLDFMAEHRPPPMRPGARRGPRD